MTANAAPRCCSGLLQMLFFFVAPFRVLYEFQSKALRFQTRIFPLGFAFAFPPWDLPLAAGQLSGSLVRQAFPDSVVIVSKQNKFWRVKSLTRKELEWNL